MATLGTVLVTGGRGYIARHILRLLLDRGYRVRASVRHASAEEELRSALGLAANDPRLAVVELDMLRDDGWTSALQGCEALIHTASPFPSVQPRDRDDLARPAIEGTQRALRAAVAADCGRVVLTSSVAAIVNHRLPSGRSVYDERDWSDPQSRLCSAYARSKTLAELAAWRFVEREAPDLRLTAINPGFVLGPPLGAGMGTSVATVARFLRGKDPLVPKVGYAAVDVRDVAQLHVEALSRPASEGGRFIAAERILGFPELAMLLKQAYPDRPVTTRTAPNWLIRLLGRFDRSVATIAPDIGRHVEVSSAKARRTFGITFAPVDAALLATAAWLVAHRRA